MSLPPGFLDELRNRLSLSQVVGRKVMWDQRKSNHGKGDMWAPCPFHQEKSASFHVDDRKGFYYCFGCHAKGDAISFVRESENMGFMEAVELLAQEAGMQMPARDPRAQQKADRRALLAEVMEQAVRHYRMQLRTSGAQVARDYLEGRGLGAAALDRFEIGFAPDLRQGLFRSLADSGVEADLVVEAGLAARPEGGGAPYDRFRGRIIFPIRDGRGRAIGLGGRAMDPQARAKYLNSPETALFDKGRSLYNLAPAREAAGRGAPLVVAEGYMDVIALSEAGFGATVAPLGTAITEDQLRLLWRLSPEPVIALDGDAAGIRAGLRLIDLALPLIEAGQSLRFALLPEGKDPDDLLRERGAEAMQGLIENARPMARLLWERETDGQSFDSPERRAALDKRLREVLRRIADPSIRSHYGAEFRRQREELFGMKAPTARSGSSWERAGPRGPAGRGQAGRGQAGGARFGPAAQAPLSSTKSSYLAARDATDSDRLREGVILAVLITHPAVLPQFEAELETLDLSGDYAVLRTLLLRHGLEGDVSDLREKIAGEAGDALEKLFSLSHVRITPSLRNPGDLEQAAACVAGELAKLQARRGAEREIAEAMEDFQGLADEGLTWRLGQAAEARHRAERSRIDESPDMGEDRGALSNFLQNLIDREVWVKKKG